MIRQPFITPEDVVCRPHHTFNGTNHTCLTRMMVLTRTSHVRYPGSQSKQYFLGLEAVFAGSGNPAYPGEEPASRR